MGEYSTVRGKTLPGEEIHNGGNVLYKWGKRYTDGIGGTVVVNNVSG